MLRAPLTVEVQNLKALKFFKWTPTGVCALVGPNGIGKSTALRLFEVLRLAIEDGMLTALRPFGGGALLHLDASSTSAPTVTVSTPQASWTIEVQRRSDPGESAREQDLSQVRIIGERTLEILKTDGSRLAIASDVGELTLRAIRRKPDAVPWLVALSETLGRSRYFARPDLEFLRANGSAEGNDVVLDTHAKDLFTVLKNWRLNSDHEARFSFVIESMRGLFPGFRSLDFMQAGQRTSARSLGAQAKLEPTDWSDGFFCCLALLTGMASVEGGIVAIDEPENSLHPELIRQLVELMREWSRTRDTTVVLATHSPVVLDQFREDPEQVFVMQPGRDQLPVKLDELKKREWLRHFSLGDLYSHLEIGAPAP